MWAGADLKIVRKADITATPKGKVFIPRIVPPDSALALALLKRQNPDIPNENWKMLHVEKLKETEANSVTKKAS